MARAVLVGRIAGVQPYTAQVRLIGDPDDHAGPKILASLYRPDPGGSPDQWPQSKIFVEPISEGMLLARDLPKKNEDGSQLSSEDLMDLPVVTRAMNNLPAGLAIGRVVDVSDSPRSMAFWDLTIEPLAGSSRLYSVMVLCPLWPDEQ